MSVFEQSPANQLYWTLRESPPRGAKITIEEADRLCRERRRLVQAEVDAAMLQKPIHAAAAGALVAFDAAHPEVVAAFAAAKRERDGARRSAAQSTPCWPIY